MKAETQMVVREREREREQQFIKLIKTEIFLKCLNKKQIRNIELKKEKGTQEYKWKTQERGAMKKRKKIAVSFCVENKFNNSE